MRTLVVSSGGSKGAWAGGVLDQLYKSGARWDKLIGSSTGSLIVPFIAADDLEGLKDCYTDLSSADIYTYDPFRVTDNTHGIFRYKINHISIIRNFFSGNTKTFGSTTKLRDLIRKRFTLTHFEKIQSSGKICYICVTNITLNRLEVKSSSDCTYDDFCDWLWASTCAPPFMSIVSKDGYEYADGGLTSPIPLSIAMELSGASHIDAVILTPDRREPPVEYVRNVFHYIQMIGRVMFYENMLNDMNLKALQGGIPEGDTYTLDIYRTNRELTNNPMIFDKTIMTDWWTEGYEHRECVSCDITNTRIAYKKRY